MRDAGARWGSGPGLTPAVAVVVMMSVRMAVAAPAGLLGGATEATLLNAESDAAYSSAPVLSPPPRVRLPDPIAREDEWRGVQCAVTQPRKAVFRHADKWEAFWVRGMAPFSAKFRHTPAIDFSRHVVVGVFLGEKPDPHYEVEIRSVRPDRRDNEEVLVVKFRVIEKMRGVWTPPFAIQPFHLKRVPLYSGRVVFEQDRR